MKVLIATGGSPHSTRAVCFGAELAAHLDQPPTLLMVVRRAQDAPRAEVILNQAASNFHNGVVPRLRVRVGQPAAEIIAEAREGGYDLIIVGERQNHTLKARLLGSTALHVVEHAACPVIIAKGDIRPIRRILMCDSGARPSILSRFTAQLAQTLRGQEEITVLHVMSQIPAWPGVPDEQLEAPAEELIRQGTPEGEWLAADLQALSLPGVVARPKVRHGAVVEEILAETEENDYDLVVIGAHRGQGWERVLLEDIAREIITQVDRSVAVVR